MAKTKTPFLSLASQGTIGNTLTSQKRGNSTVLRNKPIPTNPRSLPQTYQRWLYQDYAMLWPSQSSVTKQYYVTLGSRNHHTGFQEWMSYCLSTLPWLQGLWHLDYIQAGNTLDSSPHANHGTVYGAVPASGLIDQALYFDGNNDYISCGTSPSLGGFTALSVEFFVKKVADEVNAGYIGEIYDTAAHVCFHMRDAQFALNRVGIAIGNGVSVEYLDTLAIPPVAWRYVCFTWQAGTGWTMRVDSTTKTGGSALTQLRTRYHPLLIGRYASTYINATFDHVAVHSRVLSTAEQIRHSERRYPLQ